MKSAKFTITLTLALLLLSLSAHAQETPAGRVKAIQAALQEAKIDGWLFYDFRGSDPLAYRILQLDPTLHVTRRWYYWIPAQGVPVKLLHRIEPKVLDALPGQAHSYVSWEQQRQTLGRLLAGGLRVAMQYS